MLVVFLTRFYSYAQHILLRRERAAVIINIGAVRVIRFIKINYDFIAGWNFGFKVAAGAVGCFTTCAIYKGNK